MLISVTAYIDGFTSTQDYQAAVTQASAVINNTNGVFSFNPFTFTSPGR